MVVTYRRRPLFRDAEARELLGDVMRETCEQRPFETVAVAVLWDHVHCIWTLPQGDGDFSTRWKEIKSEFTKRWLEAGGSELAVSPSKRSRGRRGVWQPRFWEHALRDEEDFEAHFDYVHYNPTKHGYVQCPWDWPWSSFRRYVEMGHYERDWGRTAPAGQAGRDYE